MFLTVVVCCLSAAGGVLWLYREVYLQNRDYNILVDKYNALAKTKQLPAAVNTDTVDEYDSAWQLAEFDRMLAASRKTR